MRKITISIVILVAGCATQNERERLILSTSVGAAIGTGGGAAFSPNAESRGLNALVFGLTGALSGAIFAHITSKPSPEKQDAKLLREREEEMRHTNRVFQIPVESVDEIPDFLKDRISQIVVEEIPMRERIGDDGSLIEAHKAYRIRNPPELLPAPLLGEKEDLKP